jgi:hypothetical protein
MQWTEEQCASMYEDGFLIVRNAVQLGLYRLSLCSTAQPLHTRFPVIFSS